MIYALHMGSSKVELYNPDTLELWEVDYSQLFTMYKQGETVGNIHTTAHTYEGVEIDLKGGEPVLKPYSGFVNDPAQLEIRHKRTVIPWENVPIFFEKQKFNFNINEEDIIVRLQDGLYRIWYRNTYYTVVPDDVYVFYRRGDEVKIYPSVAGYYDEIERYCMVMKEHYTRSEFMRKLIFN